MKNSDHQLKKWALTAISAVVLQGYAVAANSATIEPDYKPVKQFTPKWSDAEVDALVQTTVVTIPASHKVSNLGAPAACDNISILRTKSRSADDNAEKSDGVLFLMPGILEGAGAFHHMGRQLVYMAQTQYGKNIEVWGMDRRSNCLEDQLGARTAETARTASEAEDIMIGYYYKGKPINGKKFAGFLPSKQLGFLKEFGMRQTTEDALDIIRWMMPTPGASKKKLIIGGHSMGGMLTSTFLQWQFDEDGRYPASPGYDLVAGAIGLETVLTPLADSPSTIATVVPLLKPILPLINPASATAYQTALTLQKMGVVPANTFLPGLIGPEVLALPGALGVLSDIEPHAESGALRKIGTLSPELKGFVKVLLASSVGELIFPPNLNDYRVTNQALVGLAFDKHTTPLNFLGVGLGFIKNGPVKEKFTGLKAISGLPGIGDLLSSQMGPLTKYAPVHVSANVAPLYDWASRTDIGTLPSDSLKDKTGKVTFLNLEQASTNIKDFTRSLHAPLDLTEWYFPTRMFIDTLGLVNPAAGRQHGLKLYHTDYLSKVPCMVINGEFGILTGALGALNAVQPNLIVAKGFAHVDPMFEDVSSPTQVDYVFRPTLDFMFKHLQ